jgi:hypothetical protein
VLWDVPEYELFPVMEPLFVEVVHRDASVPLASAREQEGLEPQLANLIVQLQARGDGGRLAPLHPLVKLVVVEQLSPADLNENQACHVRPLWNSHHPMQTLIPTYLPLIRCVISPRHFFSNDVPKHGIECVMWSIPNKGISAVFADAHVGCNAMRERERGELTRSRARRSTGGWRAGSRRRRRPRRRARRRRAARRRARRRRTPAPRGRGRSGRRRR